MSARSGGTLPYLIVVAVLLIPFVSILIMAVWPVIDQFLGLQSWGTTNSTAVNTGQGWVQDIKTFTVPVMTVGVLLVIYMASRGAR